MPKTRAGGLSRLPEIFRSLTIYCCGGLEPEEPLLLPELLLPGVPAVPLSAGVLLPVWLPFLLCL